MTEGPLKAEKSCPIPNTHTRLHHVHRLWHQTQASYPDPEGFCTNLNATLEALRSITFVLQKEQRAIENFASWYDEWQGRLKQDSLMRWLVEARNKVEKQGDLETFSTARVSILASWDGPQVLSDLKVNPLTSPHAIAEQLDFSQLPPQIRKEGVAVIERRWVASDLPENELLDLLAHGYGTLSTLIADAHSRAGFIMRTFSAEAHGKPVRTEHLGGRLPCMAVSAKMRTARFHLAEKAFMTSVEQSVTVDPKSGEEAAARYRASRGSLARRPEEDILDLTDRWADHAKNVLATDKYHLPTALLIMPGGESELHFLEMPDRQSIYLQWQSLADTIKVKGAIGLIFAGEFWAVLQKDLKEGQRAAEASSRKEMLQVIAATADGRLHIHSTLFSRNENGEIEFGPTEVSDGGNGQANFLAPIFRVWGYAGIPRARKPEK